MSPRLRTVGISFVALAALALAGVAAKPLLAMYRSATPLRVSWEGAVIDKNFRDVGKSLNACLSERRFTEGAMLRSNRWFSGWSCEDVGSPTVILSLNSQPRDERRYFCLDGDSLRIGEAFSPDAELNDLEFLGTWADPVQRAEACAYLKRGIEALAAGERLLVHCDAGRDRTGVYAALIAAVAFEASGGLDARAVDAIECDYEKSRSLAKGKYGRMRDFLGILRDSGGVGRFLEGRCGIQRFDLNAAVAALTRHN